MKLTESLKYSTVQFNIQSSQKRFFDASETVISGKKINKPSDDPSGNQEVLRLKSLDTSMDQYVRNMNRATHLLDVADSELQRASNLLIEIREIAVRESSESSYSRTNAAVQVNDILGELLSVANTQVEGKYIFSGFQTSTQPFDPSDSSYTYNGDAGEVKVALDETRKVALNVTGDTVFKGSGGGIDMFTELSNLKTALETDDTAGIATVIDNMDTALEQILNGRADIGTRLNEIDLRKEDIENFRLNVAARMSALEDADIATAVTELTRMQNAYTATLNSSARLMDLSLLDFLR